MTVDFGYIIKSFYVTLSLATIPLVFFNYLILFNDEIKLILSREVKKFFLTLLATTLIISHKVIFGCTLLPGIISTPDIFREFLTAALSLLLFIYNLGLAYILIKNKNNPRFNPARIPPLIIYPMIFFLFLEYILNHIIKNNRLIDDIVNISSLFFLLILIWVLYRLKMYLKIEKMIIEPIDVSKPTIIFVVGTYISSLAILISLYDITVAKAFFIISMFKFALSLLYFDRSINWIFSSKYNKVI